MISDRLPKDVVNQFVRIYEEKEDWHDKKLPHEEAVKYHKEILDKGHVIFCTDIQGVVTGYCEWWNLEHKQLKKIMCGSIHISEDNIEKGDICYVANVWIDEKYRDGELFKKMKKKLFELNKHCTYFLGEESRRDKRFRLFNRIKRILK